MKILSNKFGVNHFLPYLAFSYLVNHLSPLKVYFMTSHYNRSEIFNFFELPEAIQSELLKDENIENLECENFVKFKRPNFEAEFLPLSMFIRTDSKNNFTHGIYSTSYFDGYFITLNRSNDEAVIAHKYF